MKSQNTLKKELLATSNDYYQTNAKNEKRSGNSGGCLAIKG